LTFVTTLTPPSTPNLAPRERTQKSATGLVVARTTALWLVACCVSYTLHAQRSKDPLTPQQEEQIREASDQPDERVKLYIKFIEDRTDLIHQTVRRASNQHPGIDIHNAMQDFTRLVDELQDNLDAYDQQHMDVRKSLKYLLERTTKWSAILNEPPSSPEYDFARKTALDGVGSTNQAATELLKSQEEYFAKHKTPKN
jgi:hypothetical protein